MRAAVYRGPNRIFCEELPIPIPGPGEILVRVRACGVCGTDLKKISLGLLEPPRIFGHETAGEIARVGPGVEGWQPGDRVAVMHHVPCLACHYCGAGDYAQCPHYKRTGATAGFEPAGGGFSEYVLAMDWIVRRGIVRIPEGVTDEEATFVEPVNTVLKGVRRLGSVAGKSVVVFGQGQIGLLFTRLIASEGGQVIAIDRMNYRLGVAMQSGAVVGIDAAEKSLPERVRALTGGRGADACVVAVPGSEAVRVAFDCARSGGSVLLFAHTRLNDPVEVDGGAVCMLEKSLIGSYSADIGLQEEAADLVFRHRLPVADLVTHSFSLEEIGLAIDLASHPRENSLKVMMRP